MYPVNRSYNRSLLALKILITISTVPRTNVRALTSSTRKVALRSQTSSPKTIPMQAISMQVKPVWLGPRSLTLQGSVGARAVK